VFAIGKQADGTVMRRAPDGRQWPAFLIQHIQGEPRAIHLVALARRAGGHDACLGQQALGFIQLIELQPQQGRAAQLL